MNFVFLIYVPRSGSTLIARTLAGRTRELVVLPEFRLPNMLVAEGEPRVHTLSAEQVLALMHLDHQIDSLGLSPAELEAIARDTAGQGTRAIIEAIARSYIARRAPERPDATTVIIKLGILAYVADALMGVFTDAKFLHVYRDPRAVTSSQMHTTRAYEQRDKMGRGDPVFIARQYVRVIRAVRKLAGRAPVHDVSYERFCTDTDGEIAAMARFVGVELLPEAIAPSFEVKAKEQSIHRLVDKPPDAERTSAWREELPGWAGLAVERTLGPLLGELGYEPHFATDLPPGRARAWRTRAALEHVRRTAQHYLRRAAYYRTRPALLGNRLKLAWRRRDG